MAKKKTNSRPEALRQSPTIFIEGYEFRSFEELEDSMDDCRAKILRGRISFIVRNVTGGTPLDVSALEIYYHDHRLMTIRADGIDLNFVCDEKQEDLYFDDDSEVSSLWRICLRLEQEYVEKEYRFVDTGEPSENEIETGGLDEYAENALAFLLKEFKDPNLDSEKAKCAIVAAATFILSEEAEAIGVDSVCGNIRDIIDKNLKEQHKCRGGDNEKSVLIPFPPAVGKMN